ncbi:MAG: hypothetical protein Q7U70_05245 [Methylotenera sp.]|nr:hypothetical protein [Methylotenera sp.]MDO9389148.1 hypothetical protein [Methylotenera sp.]
MKISLELQGNTLEYENDAVTESSEMWHAFGDGEEGHEYCYATSWQDFIGTAFHLIQQTGGNLLLNGVSIHAANFSDTNGSSVTKETVVALGNGETLPLSQLLVVSSDCNNNLN